MIARLFLLSPLAVAGATGAEKRPNLVLILADDCTYLDMEVYGGQAKTPHLTRGIINGSDAFGIRSIGTATHRYILNLHPETTFTNAVTGKYQAGWWASWTGKAESGDERAKALVYNYQHRPAEELYDIVEDPHCTRNLIGNPALADTRQDLKRRLLKWMEAQGDQGDETERLALTRMPQHKNQRDRSKTNDSTKTTGLSKFSSD